MNNKDYEWKEEERMRAGLPSGSISLFVFPVEFVRAPPICTQFAQEF
ncbi:MAG: hypothetical protein IT343_04020 [Candidatus Melainabacteria bacterium]|jgi:hypothetical protein|nr:hypothetical protein [Candidatus Melainabacteria bacterium]